MNVSIRYSYNLGWKLALVLKGFARPSILKTYDDERRKVALDLVAFDQRFFRTVSSRPAAHPGDTDGVSIDESKDAFEKQKLFSSGCVVE